MDLKDVAINESKATEGVWVEIDSLTSVRIARFMNPRFNKLFQQLAPKNTFVKQGLIDLEDEKADKILNECLAKTVLLGWRGLLIDGEEVAYSVEKCMEILADKQYARFKSYIIDLAKEEEHFRDSEVNEAVGKLANT